MWTSCFLLLGEEASTEKCWTDTCVNKSWIQGAHTCGCPNYVFPPIAIDFSMANTVVTSLATDPQLILGVWHTDFVTWMNVESQWVLFLTFPIPCPLHPISHKCPAQYDELCPHQLPKGFLISWDSGTQKSILYRYRMVLYSWLYTFLLNLMDILP